jgi:predicted  nucleic acid-binding Zn-ribbon protein
MTMSARLLERLDALLVKDRSDLAAMGVREVEDTYTDACAEALSLEVQALRVKRRMGAAELDLATDGEETARELQALAVQRRELAGQLAELRQRLARLREMLHHLSRAEGTAERAPRFRRG